VNVAKLGKNLARIGVEHRIAQPKGEASELRLLSRGDDIVLAWNEVRTDAVMSGIFAARLTSADLTARGDTVRVVQAVGHARGLDLAPMEDGVVVGWVEDDVAKSAAEPNTPRGMNGPSGKKVESAAKRKVALARLDPSLRLVGEPVRPSLASDPGSIALDCDQTCRVVVQSAEQGQLSFYGFAYDGGRSTAPPARLSVIPGASTEDVSPVLVGDWLFFAEDNLHGGGRLRRAKIAWR
jgi:hypothetical protein